MDRAKSTNRLDGESARVQADLLRSRAAEAKTGGARGARHFLDVALSRADAIAWGRAVSRSRARELSRAIVVW